ncbi:MAG: hypothetical protein P4L53_03940 [Candidatus Obscuribacterales bacterium]|nr:hypothetical protein [Candidatus Obscuribacterales bacterium]
MTAIDAPSKNHDSPVQHREGDATRTAQKLHECSVPTSSTENKQIAQGCRPDTARLHELHIDDHTAPKATEVSADIQKPKVEANKDSPPQPGVTKDRSGNVTEVKPKPEGGYTEVTKDKTGSTTYSKSASADGSFTDMCTADGVMTATEQDAKGNYVKHVINGADMTTITHKLDGQGGYTDTTSKSDHTQNIHEQKANGDFKDSNYRNGTLENEKIRIMKDGGGYSEYTKPKDGPIDTKTFNADGHLIPNPPPDQSKSPVESGIDAVNENATLAKKAGEIARDAGTVASGIKAITKGLEAVPSALRFAGGAGTPLGLLGRAAQVGGSAVNDVEEGKKEALAVGVGTAVRYGLGGTAAASSMGIGAPVALALGTGAGAVAETCTRDALHGENCGEKALQWQHDNFWRAVEQDQNERLAEYRKAK